MGHAEFPISMKKRNKQAKKSWEGIMLQKNLCGGRDLVWRRERFSLCEALVEKKTTNRYPSQRKTTHKPEQWQLQTREIVKVCLLLFGLRHWEVGSE